MNYPHWGVITRPPAPEGTPGGWTDDDGIWHDDPAAPDVSIIFEGPGDYQDKGEVIETDSAGRPTAIADGVFFPKKERVAMAVEPNDLLEITFEDKSKEQGQVLRVRRLDGAIMVRRM